MAVSAMQDVPMADREVGRNDACLAVLAMPELLEVILEMVDVTTLLTSAQRVCKKWHAVIQTSNMQRLLYLEPCGVPKAPQGSREGDLLVEQNPLLKTLFPYLFQIMDVARRQLPTCTGYLTLTLGGCVLADRRVDYKRHYAFVRHDASWRRMQVSRPPLRHHDLYRTLDFPDGLRMGQLWDILFRAVFESYSEDIDPRDGDGPAILALWRQHWPHNMRTPPKGRGGKFNADFDRANPWLVPTYSDESGPDDYQWLYACEDYNPNVLEEHFRIRA
ncbi:unnamed protein product [Parascedosporium putredinis]|uniref:F-box domain-containing protein n=1 Tax=Parascedosporium putredinis TaxID=1442378 RepID=A0A9P1M9I0_9PEZI|nr:unnamed protein product [Parascedosporium putredinis]CAI7994863.1 unnamed protein product [Parascedosporium putredinis]